MDLPRKVLVITGATSGIGISLLERLLLQTRLQFILRICILCRNMAKGEMVRSALMLSNKSAEIELVKMDTGDVRSVLDAVKVVKAKYDHIDYLYLNAGILPIKGVNPMAVFSRDISFRLKTGAFVLETDNPINEHGIPSIFSTNILGHFLLFQDLLPLLKPEENSSSKVIWTTSNNAVKNCFDIKDFMCEHGPLPYGSSKYIMNAASIMINKIYNNEGLYSCLAEPGLCVTPMISSFIPRWLWVIVEFFFKLLRVFLSHFTLSSFNGAESLLWLFKQDPKNLEMNHQYESAVTVFNEPYVRNARLEMTEDEAERIYNKLCDISKRAREQVEE